jgi:glycosyltransferase involved in cell wall biosynthesis
MRIAMLLHKSVEYDSRVRREADALASAGHQVWVLELAEVPGGAAGLDGFTRRSCLPPSWLRRWLPFHLYRASFLLYFLWGIVRVRPDVVHAHDAAMLLPGAIGARLVGARLVYDSHELATGVPYRDAGWAWFVAALEGAIVPRCAAVITVSDGIAERLQQRYRLAARPTVVRNVSALTPQGPGGLRSRLGLDRSSPLVLHQGAPAPERGCENLIRATARLDGVTTVFLGDAEAGYRSELDAIIGQEGVADRVALLPSVGLNELLGYTAEADVGVTLLRDICENHRLALPNKLFEYIAAGVPVLASALPETERLIRQYGVGWCVEGAGDDALVDGLSRALAGSHDPELGERLRLAAAELRWPVERRRVVDLYQALSSGR